LASKNEGNDMTEPILEVKDLSLFYGKKQSLFNINMDFYPGEITALIGPSGSGKSTLVRSINRMNDLVSSAKVTGKIMYKEQDIYSSKTDMVELRKEIGMVFQQPNPFPFSIYENVIYGLRLKGIKDKAVLDEAVEESLKAANIWDEVKDKLHSSALGLSGGQQQRVCIARVLAVNPKILLLDEPTSALDPISAGKIEAMLLDLKEKYTILIVTHSMQQASRISDRTAFFLNGELIEYDKTKKIFLDPKEKSTSDYVTGKFG
jgi:phosphate transport system ATP-binding protein